MKESPEARITRTLRIGGVFASREPAEVHTVLGSCVSACLYDRVAGVGGMNHFLLPWHPTGEPVDSDSMTRFGVHAMEVLINELMRLGGDRNRFEAKLFGGAAVLDMATGLGDIGLRNQEFVLEFLRVEGIPVTGHRLGGFLPSEVRFFTETATALVRKIDTGRVARLKRAELMYSKRLEESLKKAEREEPTFF